MTAATTTTFGNFLVKIGDGASPEVFTAPCGLTSKGFNQTANTQKTAVPDCSNPDLPADNSTGVDTIDRSISGSGVLATEAFTTWQAWFDSSASKNVRIYPMGASGGYYSGAFVLTQFNMSVDRGQKVNVEVAMEADGHVTWNP